jgi:hypothetical protein
VVLGNVDEAEALDATPRGVRVHLALAKGVVERRLEDRPDRVGRGLALALLLGGDGGAENAPVPHPRQIAEVVEPLLEHLPGEALEH